MGNIIKNVVPKMTSATTPLGVVSSSSNFSANETAYKAFDRVPTPSSRWSSATLSSNPLPAWIAYDFGLDVIINSYAITSQNGYEPSTWQFQAWDGATWVDLDSQSNQIWDSSERKEYNINSNGTAYSQYRLYITDTTVVSPNVVIVCELELLAPDPFYPWLTLPASSDEVAQHTDYNLPVTFHNATDSNVATATKTMTNNRVVGTGTEYIYTIDGASWASLKNLVISKG